MSEDWKTHPEGRALVAGIVGALGGLVGQVYRRAVRPIQFDGAAVWTNVFVSFMCSAIFDYAAGDRYAVNHAVGMAFVVGIIAVNLVSAVEDLDFKEILRTWLENRFKRK